MQYIRSGLLAIICVTLIGVSRAADDKPEYKMCVPHLVYNACEELVATKTSEFATIKCVSARDRMECLEKVNRREADFVAVDPEDMYVAFHMNNEDFSVFSEIRTVEEPEAEFRYEGIILVRKNSGINSLKDLQGKKSCHTGYGRNVGYKIPITKLRKHGVLKLSTDPSLSPLEKELKALSEMFTQSCLVGTYSPHDDVNLLLKKRYSNLCALCEDPVKCNYPDKYSGYEGAIRCLVENGGDVAFTKVIYVRRFFGLSINNQIPKTIAQANPDDYEYLCEDSTRAPITGQACTWAQRPWQGYMGNSDIKTRLTKLQDRINEFYNEGKKSSNKEAAAKLWINEKNVVVKKEKEVLPGDHLVRAQYKDVIERDGSTQQKIRLCVQNDVEMRKCEVMRQAAYSRDIRPEFICKMSSNCIHSVRTNESDVVILTAVDRPKAKDNQLNPIVFESIDDHYLVVAKKDVNNELLDKTPIQYNTADARNQNAALNFNFKRGNGKCSGLTTDESSVRIVRLSELGTKAATDLDEILCRDGRKPTNTQENELRNCFYDATPPTAVFVRNTVGDNERDNIEHAFLTLSDKFGKMGKIEEVFELFGEFESGQSNVLFSDDGVKLTQSVTNLADDEDSSVYKRMQCIE